MCPQRPASARPTRAVVGGKRFSSPQQSNPAARPDRRDAAHVKELEGVLGFPDETHTCWNTEMRNVVSEPARGSSPGELHVMPSSRFVDGHTFGFTGATCLADELTAALSVTLEPRDSGGQLCGRRVVIFGTLRRTAKRLHRASLATKVLPTSLTPRTLRRELRNRVQFGVRPGEKQTLTSAMTKDESSTLEEILSLEHDENERRRVLTLFSSANGERCRVASSLPAATLAMLHEQKRRAACALRSAPRVSAFDDPRPCIWRLADCEFISTSFDVVAEPIVQPPPARGCSGRRYRRALAAAGSCKPTQAARSVRGPLSASAGQFACRRQFSVSTWANWLKNAAHQHECSICVDVRSANDLMKFRVSANF